MQTTINIDNQLFAQAVKITATDDSEKIVDLALREFIANHASPSSANMLDLCGAGGILADYDYKQLRCDQN